MQPFLEQRELSTFSGHEAITHVILAENRAVDDLTSSGKRFDRSFLVGQ